MPARVYAIPNYEGTRVDLVLCDPANQAFSGTLHYSYAIAADAEDIQQRRTFPWQSIRDFGDARFQARQRSAIQRIRQGQPYRPGEGVLDLDPLPGLNTDHKTIMRLGALELLGNIASGRLSTNEKDPFPHQLALQQHFKSQPPAGGLRRMLIADEVGLGKTVEVALILRDILLAKGTLQGFTCLYVTPGGLVQDAANKLRDVLRGAVDGQNIVSTPDRFVAYGRAGNTLGVQVVSTQAVRRYVTAASKANLPAGLAPDIIIIDECHQAGCDDNLGGALPTPQNATNTYCAVYQLLTGTFWSDSSIPGLGILMSATPFRTQAQFTNLLRLVTHGVGAASGFDAYGNNVDSDRLCKVLGTEGLTASVIWRRQTDNEVRSWSGARIFPNLTVIRPHNLKADDQQTPHLLPPSGALLRLIDEIKQTIAEISREHGAGFGGFARVQLEKKLTSSSIAGACALFTWAVRRRRWQSQTAYGQDVTTGTESLRNLLRCISRKIAAATPGNQADLAAVTFRSDRFEFAAQHLRPGAIPRLYEYAEVVQAAEEGDDKAWTITDDQMTRVVTLAQRLLGIEEADAAVEAVQETKLTWLRELLRRHPDERFLLFTESLQTCECLKNTLGEMCDILDGGLDTKDRLEVVRRLGAEDDPLRILVATSAADEGIDLQVASRVVHWDLSSSPATLMQRNGRAARLGQVRDVTAYYLILQGTHEARRDESLQRKFGDLGIDDDSLQNRILGSLTDDEQDRLEQAIEDNNQRVAGEILERAKTENDQMDANLQRVRATLRHSQVLSRNDLSNRLEMWKDLGWAEVVGNETHLQFEELSWRKPIFQARGVQMEDTVSTAATISRADRVQRMIFDPEFFVFGPKSSGERPRLAGLNPWVSRDDHHGRTEHLPSGQSELLGILLREMVRLPAADFMPIKRNAVPEGLVPAGTCWVLMCTHPLREQENVFADAEQQGHELLLDRPYLTYYCFGSLDNVGGPFKPLAPSASAAEVQEMIGCLECFARAGGANGSEGLDYDNGHYPYATNAEALRDRARAASTAMSLWIEGVTKDGQAGFGEQSQRFVPFPVALIGLFD